MHNQVRTTACLTYGTGAWWETEHLPVGNAINEADIIIRILSREGKPAHMLYVDEKNPLARWEFNGWFVQVEIEGPRVGG